MLKFEYHPQQNLLYTQKPGEPRCSITKTFTTNWDSPGFVLEPESHWITFTVYSNKIRVFYKEVKIDSSLETHAPNPKWKDWVVSTHNLALQSQVITYYQKDLKNPLFNKKASNLPKTSPLIFTFTKEDEVHKVNNQWVKKH